MSRSLAPNFAFFGHVESTGKGFGAVCDHAPLVAWGPTRAEALDHMAHSISLYLGQLHRQGVLEEAVQRGLVRLLARPMGASVRIKQSKDRFTAEVPAFPSEPAA